MALPATAKAQRFDTITDIPRESWNAGIAGDIEDYDYLLAVERSHISGFRLCIYAVMDGPTVLAAVPAFFTDYDLATTADGAVRQFFLRIQKIFPKLLTLPLACIGSFATETCPAAFHPTQTDAQKQEAFAHLLVFFIEDTRLQKIYLLACKDMSGPNKALLNDVITAHKFTCVGGMPTAISNIQFSSIDAYLASLSSGTRKDMRRKLRKQSEVRIEYHTDISDNMDDIYAMYLETKGRSDLQFEELTPDYFREVLRCMGRHALCSLYYTGERIVGANLMLVNEQRLLDKFFCMRSDSGYDLNLYFLSWFANIQYCIDNKLSIYQSGQAGYETKLRLGSILLENWMYFRHRNPLVNTLLKLASPMLEFDIPKEIKNTATK